VEQQLTVVEPGAPCTKPPAGPPGVGSVAPRPPAHPSRAGGRGRQSLPEGDDRPAPPSV